MNRIFKFMIMCLAGSAIGFFGTLEASSRYTLQVMAHETAIFVLFTAGVCGLSLLVVRKMGLI